MSVLLQKLARYVVQRATSDPESRDRMLKAAARGVGEAKQLAKEDDRAYAAGQALRRALKGR